MFKKSKRKIVVSILSVLILLLFGTFCVIYLASYADMTKENRLLLKQYADSYVLFQETDSGDENGAEGTGIKDIGGETEKNPDGDEGKRNDRINPPIGSPMLKLSTFYSVAISKDGEVLKTDTADISTFEESELTEMAQEILNDGKSDGIKNNLLYKTEDKGEYILVAFLDNTVMLKNVDTLIGYTLIFGGVALIVMFFLARYLAEKIVSPLEESYQKQKQFISDAGHELKTPTAIINANADLLSREIGENRWLANIQYENERMSALIAQLLDLARTESSSPWKETTDLSRLVYGETLPFESVAYENGLVLNSDIEENIKVNGNAGQLKQLTSILLDNAVRHGKKGNEVRLTLKKEKNHAVLSVVNDGEEIPPEKRKHLFERFYKTDDARPDDYRHYGLGLTIAKAVAVAHKGTINVRCYDGKIEFSVKIPSQNK